MKKTTIRETIVNLLINGLDGNNSHLSPKAALEGLSVDTVSEQATHAPYTIWQQIVHINFWQKRFVAHLKGEKLPPVLKAAEGWPDEKGPPTQEILQKAIAYLLESINESKLLLLQDRKLYYPSHYMNGYEVIRAMGNHLSYHIGQIMTLRRILADYPPPSGGDTW